MSRRPRSSPPIRASTMSVPAPMWFSKTSFIFLRSASSPGASCSSRHAREKSPAAVSAIAIMSSLRSKGSLIAPSSADPAAVPLSSLTAFARAISHSTTLCVSVSRISLAWGGAASKKSSISLAVAVSCVRTGMCVRHTTAVCGGSSSTQPRNQGLTFGRPVCSLSDVMDQASTSARESAGRRGGRVRRSFEHNQSTAHPDQR